MMKEKCAAALHWWREEMSTLLPWVRDADPVIALWRTERTEFWQRSATGVAAVDPARLPPGAPLILRLADAKPWRRSFELPRGARRFLRQIVTGEMDRRTPWRADQVYFDVGPDPAPAADGKISVSLTVLPLTSAAPALEAMTRLGLEPVALELVAGGDPARRGPIVPLSVTAGRSLARGGRAVSALAVVLAAALLSVAAQAAWLGFVDARLAQARQDVRTVRSLAADITRLRRQQDFPHVRRQESPASLTVLNALAQGLPDDSWAEQITLGGGKLTMIGHSADATRLLSLIGTAGPFADPRFDAPVTAAAKGGQNFALSARLTEADGR
jgi:general secretion pathway protein L